MARTVSDPAFDFQPDFTSVMFEDLRNRVIRDTHTTHKEVVAGLANAWQQGHNLRMAARTRQIEEDTCLAADAVQAEQEQPRVPVLHTAPAYWFFHADCDSRLILKYARSPATSNLIPAFTAFTAGSYSCKTIANYIIGRKKRQPYTVEFMCAFYNHLNPNSSPDAAIYGCLTTALYCTARVGEFTVPTLSSFDPNIHVKLADTHVERDRNNLEMRVFTYHGPKRRGKEKTHLSRSRMDPQTRGSSPASPAIILSPSDEAKFVARLAQAAKATGMNPLQGHGIRIGSTLEYLLRDIPSEVVKTKGRWATDAFQLYLRKYAQIMGDS
ncbi:hypothetical protein AZE42_12564 [Rhizopogon vesiculosus]|uniref:Uncharacterized protein n=1 Tax=Rhizopogon vesiculosus TaxID=180088 RepID=A0A1J8R6L5_9AGAM|nr:hypothetical protein AZE42_12564 [Rhizopogon vesiculosus]